MTDEAYEDELTGALARSLPMLREEIPVRPEWRASLLERVEADRLPSRGWRIHPMVAAAAGIALLIGGAAIGRLSRLPSEPGVVQSSAGAVANVRFVLVAPGAVRVSVVGDFNQWNANAMPLRKLTDGTWIVDVPLGAGRYAYAFVVDGRIQVDPSAPRAEGEFGENSILMVRGS